MWVPWEQSADLNRIPSQDVLTMKLIEIALSLLFWGRNRTRKIFENFFLTPIFILELCEEICLFHNIISKH